jgi:hypothetical protein
MPAYFHMSPNYTIMQWRNVSDCNTDRLRWQHLIMLLNWKWYAQSTVANGTNNYKAND